MFWGLTAAAAAALALAAPSFAQGSQPELTVVPYDVALGRVADTELDLTLPTSTSAAAKVVIYAAPGYTANLATAPGTKVGTLSATIDAGGATLPVSNAAVTADDPAKYTSNAAAQVCAPGKHAAVWVINVALGTTTLAIPIFVDPTSGTETALGSYKLQVCFASPYVDPSVGGAPGHARLTEADIDFGTGSDGAGVFRNPGAGGVYRWRSFVTPYTQGTSTPNAGGTFELRSIAQLPLRIGLKGKYDKRHKRAVIKGTFRPSADLGMPASVIVDIYRISASGAKHVGRVRTKKGAFTFRTKQAKGTSVYSAIVAGYAGACTGGPSVAPAGCTHETAAPVFSGVARIKRTR
jgi:hypothetical protein